MMRAHPGSTPVNPGKIRRRSILPASGLPREAFGVRRLAAAFPDVWALLNARPYLRAPAPFSTLGRLL